MKTNQEEWRRTISERLAPLPTIKDEEIVHNLGYVAETTPGGRALKYYSTIRMSVRRGESLKGEDGELAGQ